MLAIHKRKQAEEKQSNYKTMKSRKSYIEIQASENTGNWFKQNKTKNVRK